MPAQWDIQTPAISGAVAVIQISGEPAEVAAAAETLGPGPMPLERPVLRDVLGIDRAVIARWSERSLHIMPHGGPAVVRAIAAELERRGIHRAQRPDSRLSYPEAADEVEARMLAALARAASPLAIDLLLDQPRRWREGVCSTDDGHSRILNRLIDPPLVVAAGPPNVGKSALVNALAGRSVSIVADQPGTTRDHVGVLIDLAGLVVRYVDTPGLGRRADAVEVEAEAIARLVIASADLVLCCGDCTAAPADLDLRTPSIRLALRSDLDLPRWAHELAVSSLTGVGLPELVAAIRDRLVPPGVLADSRPWRFW